VNDLPVSTDAPAPAELPSDAPLSVEAPAPAAERKPPRWVRKFLAVLRETGNHSAACHAARIDRTTPYKAMREDQDFAAAYKDAMDEACDALELEARRRAHDGVDKPVVYQGELCGTWVDAQGRVVTAQTPGARLVPLTLKEYSDSLLLALLRAHRPEKFRDNAKIEHSGTGAGGAIAHEVNAHHEHHVDALSDPDRLAAIFRALAEAVPAAAAGACPPGDAPADEVRPAHAPPQAGGLPAAGLP
jgi:hypothetical protein